MKELSLEELNEVGKEIRSQVLLRTRPVAIKLIKEVKDFPSKIKFPYKDLKCKVSPCQAVHIVRTWGITLGMTEEDFLEMPCPLFWGFGLQANGKELTDEELAKHWVEEMDFFRDVESAMHLLKNAPRIPRGSYIGLVMSPLEWTRVEPDVVVIYGTPGQISKLIFAINYSWIPEISSSFSSAAAFCIEGLRALLDQKPKVFFPEGGERGIAMTQDSELGIAIPPKGLKETVEGLRAGKTGAVKYPVAPYLHFTATEHPYVKLGLKVKK